MVATNRVVGTVLQVVAYYRMSSDDQTTSIEQQKKEVRAYAKRHGWDIVREYEDPGLSGSTLPWEKRPGFVAMLDYCKLREVNAVLVWHSSRFGRLDSQYSQASKIILRELGMWLESVKEGRIDWATSMGRMMDALISEQNNQYSHTLSANVVRGHNAKARDGWRSIGVAPFGYDREYVDEGGVSRMVVRRTDRFKSPLNWRLRLIINKDEAAIVRSIFERFVGGHSLCSICRDLTDKGITVPYAHRPTRLFRRSTWGVSTVRAILENKVYIGTSVIGAEHAKRSLNHVQFYERPNTFPAIIDPDTFASAQRLNDAKKTRKIKPRTGGGPLNGVLYCGCCGQQLFRKVEKSGKDRKLITYYTCRSSVEKTDSKCKSWRVREDQILPVVLENVMRVIDVETLQAMEAKPAATLGAELAGLRQRRDELQRDFDRGSQNLLLASPTMFPVLQVKLDELKNELDKATNTINLAAVSDGDAERRTRLEWLRSVKGKLVTLVEPAGMEDACPWPLEPSRRQEDFIHELLGNPPAPGVIYVDGEPIWVQHSPSTGNVHYWEFERSVYSKALQTDVASLRSLLLRLNLRVSITWTPNGERRYKVHKAEITGDTEGTTAFFDGAHGLNAGTAPMAHLLGSSS